MQRQSINIAKQNIEHSHPTLTKVDITQLIGNKFPTLTKVDIRTNNDPSLATKSSH